MCAIDVLFKMPSKGREDAEWPALLLGTAVGAQSGQSGGRAVDASGRQHRRLGPLVPRFAHHRSHISFDMLKSSQVLA